VISVFEMGLVNSSKNTTSAFFRIFTASEPIPLTPEIPRPTNHSMIGFQDLVILTLRDWMFTKYIN
jgi:hypothetical protein